MSVQAQYPSNVLLPEFRKRARPEARNGGEDMPVQENVLHFHSAGVNFPSQPAVNEVALLENVLVSNTVSGGRKKTRVDESISAKQQISLAPFVLEPEKFLVPACSLERSMPSVPALNPQQSIWPCSNGIPVAVASTIRCLPSATLTGGVASTPSSFIPDAYLQLHCCQQEAEINQIVAKYGEQLKQALEEKRQQHTRALLELIDRCVISRVKERLVEVEKVRQRNVELEDCVRKLSLESQVWMNVAHSHEALVTSLRSNLEQLVAQSKEHAKGRCGESDAEDAESCVHGNSVDAGNAFAAQAVNEMKDVKEPRNCRFCKRNSISVLLLPCRHLCLCTDCDINLSHCPICGASKSASLQVYLE